MRIALILTLMIFCYTGVTQAQTQPDWHVVIHNNADGQIYTINAEGMTNVYRPFP